MNAELVSGKYEKNMDSAAMSTTSDASKDTNGDSRSDEDNLDDLDGVVIEELLRESLWTYAPGRSSR